jgi:FOG: WD40 repeat
MKYFYSIILLSSIVSLTFAKGKYNETIFSTESLFIYDACLSGSGKEIICTDNNTLKVFSIENKKLLGNFSGGHHSKILCVALSPDATMVASGGGDSTIVVWNFSTHSIIEKITFATGKITSIKFSPDNQLILFGCSNSRAYLWSIKERRKVYEFSDQEKDVTSVAFSPNGSLIAIAGGDKKIRIYNTTDFQLKSELKGHTNWVRSICFYNQGKNLISVGDDKKVIQWNLSNHNFQKTYMHKDWILSVDIDNNEVNKSYMYALGTMNGSIKIKYSLGFYEAKLNSPINKVVILPNESGEIELAVATLGSGFINLSAANMNISQ